MRIEFSSYALDSLSSRKKREGALLRVHFADGLVGYSDCHAWPELGDEPLHIQLDLLSRGEETPITRSALFWARVDAEGRQQGKTLLSESVPLQSHYLIPDIFQCDHEDIQSIVSEGFSHVKIKLGSDIEKGAFAIGSLLYNKPLKLRLDFNECLDSSSFRDFLQMIDFMRQQIDFFEDPFPFDPKQWKRCQREGWRLACDRRADQAVGHPEASSVLVYKPAIQPLFKPTGQTWIVTSYLGHPFGQAIAAYAAMQIDSRCEQIHGLLSHRVYAPNRFSQKLNWIGPFFKQPPGLGFGFDEELQQVKWSWLND
jgi:O-succinylbenzoate synthase